MATLRRLKTLAVFLSGFLLFYLIFFPKKLELSGPTMGATYHVIVYVPRWVSATKVQTTVETRLAIATRAISTLTSDTQLSRFNVFETSAPFPVSADIRTVYLKHLELYQATDGALDPTIKPVMDLWGASGQAPALFHPSRSQIQNAMAHVGMRAVTLSQRGLSKSDPKLTMDLTDIQRGFCVDSVAEVLRTQGYRNFYIEIRGRVAVSGTRRFWKSWRIGVFDPSAKPPLRSMVTIGGNISAVASRSAVHRDENGVLQPIHLIDPRSGFPARNNVVAVTAVSTDALSADGWSAALMVLGVKRGLAVLRQQKGVEAMFLVRGKKNKLELVYSPGFSKYQLHQWPWSSPTQNWPPEF